ncbi:MAG: hypothetical protein KC591_09805 [Gemmatimonadetes bacterium]|nr:hypothetical protein [Gemmatimonadota bacterium]
MFSTMRSATPRIGSAPCSGAGGAVSLGDDNRLSYVRTAGEDTTRFSYKVERDYNLFSFSKNKTIEGARVVFVGFGITA